MGERKGIVRVEWEVDHLKSMCVILMQETSFDGTLVEKPTKGLVFAVSACSV